MRRAGCVEVAGLVGDYGEDSGVLTEDLGLEWRQVSREAVDGFAVRVEELVWLGVIR